jgi:hypothetical protein
MTMKNCRVCHQEKALSEFGVNRHIKCGVNSMCKACGNKATAEYRARTYVAKPPRVSKKQSIEAFKVKQKEWREKNKDAIAQRVAAWQKANTEKGRAKAARYRERNPNAGKESYLRSKELNPELIGERCARRRAQKKRAAPTWANSFFIREAYHLAKLRTKATGIVWEVDHIYPLQSDVVCGLHVETNLRVVPRMVNRSKGNKVIHHG